MGRHCLLVHLDLWLRHGSANHKRETIAWSKRRQRAMERLAVNREHWLKCAD